MNIKAIAGRIGMDYDNVIEDFCGDTGEIRKKLESFVSDCDFPALRSAVESGDGEDIRKRAHKVKKTGENSVLSHWSEVPPFLRMRRTERYLRHSPHWKRNMQRSLKY